MADKFRKVYAEQYEIDLEMEPDVHQLVSEAADKYNLSKQTMFVYFLVRGIISQIEANETGVKKE